MMSVYRYLKCVQPDCKVQATMSSEGDSLVDMTKESPAHNHLAVTQEEDPVERMLIDSTLQPVSSADECDL